MRMEQARNLRYTQSTDNLSSDVLGDPDVVDLSANTNCPATPLAFGLGVIVQRDFRNIAGFTFCTNRTVVAIDTNTKSVTIRVGWRWRNEDYNHNIRTVVRRQSG